MSSASPKEIDSLESLVGQVADEFLRRQEAGEHPDVEEYATRHPEPAELLRKVLASLKVLDLSHPLAAEGNGDSAAPRELGDFRLIREVGRGGMGIVYEAEQLSLGRRVALKVLPFAATMDPRHLQRFHNEARAAAGLHHTNVVPVYFVGCERGVHFYAMQFIEGRSLAALLEQLRTGLPSADQPTTAHTRALAGAASETAADAATRTVPAPRDSAYFRRVAEWGMQAAEALDHAHQMGIVHRDVKPANLLIDSAGRLWVTDFGLAQFQSDVRLTITGDLVGTLRYMSPEQALAKRVVVDHRTDVYSLGATLYELLTLEPVFLGSDRQELLRQIAFEEPVVPRRVNRAIPLDLQTVVLKALEKNPADRYSTAQELADDLRRWLDERPICARRPTLFQVARKWTRRHRGLVTAAAICLFAITVILAASVVTVTAAYEAERHERNRAENASRDEAVQRGTAERERDTAEDRLYLADMHRASQYLAGGNREQLRLLLESHRPGPDKRDRRGWEWYYLRGLCEREPLVIQEGYGLTDLRWLGANRLEVTGQGGLKIWDLDAAHKSASVHWSREGPGAPVSAWSPDGTRLAWLRYIENNRPRWEMRVEDGGSGKTVCTVPLWTGPVAGSTLAWSPDSTRVATWHKDAARPRPPLAGEHPVLNIWDIRTGNLLVTCRTTAPRLNGFGPLAWSPDGKLLAQGAGVLDECSAVRIWDTTSGREVRVIRADTGATVGFGRASPTCHLAWSPDSKRLAVSGSLGRSAEVHDVNTGRRLVSLPAQAIGGMAWSSDGTNIAMSHAVYPNLVTIWDIVGGHEIFTLHGPAEFPGPVSWSPDGRQVASADLQRGIVQIWDVSRSPHATRVGSHRKFVNLIDVAWDREGRRLLSLANDGTIKIWEWDHKQELLTVRTQGSGSACWSPDGQRLAVFCAKPLRLGSSPIQSYPQVAILDAQTGKQLQVLSGAVVDGRRGGPHPIRGARTVPTWPGWVSTWALRFGTCGRAHKSNSRPCSRRPDKHHAERISGATLPNSRLAPTASSWL
jgi:serine/threonine protein kinase/WD40 repeat protein